MKIVQYKTVFSINNDSYNFVPLSHSHPSTTMSFGMLALFVNFAIYPLDK